jgi:predicted GIY-YIG superfamily endonuclease
MTIKPILINPILYVLQLENNKYYIGITMNLNMRIAQHFSGEGSKWTKLHKPITIVEIQIKNITEQLENEITLFYMRKYGWQSVRGGSYTKIDLKKPLQLTK